VVGEGVSIHDLEKDALGISRDVELGKPGMGDTVLADLTEESCLRVETKPDRGT
jgi:hypothetical protein